MQHLKRLMIFAQVVEHGSMTAASRQLEMSPSAVSQQIRQLEQESGVTLLHRSTRKLTLTEAGEHVYHSCRQMLEAAREAESRLLAQRDAPVGELRIACPIRFASKHLTWALAPLLVEYPQLGLRLLADNLPADLVGDRIDLALHLGPLPDSQLVARPLAWLKQVLCASPAYLARMGYPLSPDDLHHHHILIMTSRAQPNQFELKHQDGRQSHLTLQGRIQANESQTLANLNLAGLGIFQRFAVDVHPELGDGRLVSILPEWQLPEIPLYAVTTTRDSLPAKVRYAIDAIRNYLQGANGPLQSAGGQTVRVLAKDDS